MQFVEFLQRCLWGRRERKSFLPDGEGGMPRRGRGAGRAANAGVHGGGGERMLRSGARITFRNLSAFLGFWALGFVVLSFLVQMVSCQAVWRCICACRLAGFLIA